MGIRWAIIKKRAVEVLRQVGVDEAPVPVEECARSIGAIVRYQPFEGSVSGMVHRVSDNKAIIGINSLHPENRKRFSIAHEIGHLLLHDDRELYLDEFEQQSIIGFRDLKSSLGVDEKEIEANQFAAELLMPEEMLRRDFELTRRETADPEGIIDSLSKQYKVSVQSMTIRLSRLELIR